MGALYVIAHGLWPSFQTDWGIIILIGLVIALRLDLAGYRRALLALRSKLITLKMTEEHPQKIARRG